MSHQSSRTALPAAALLALCAGPLAAQEPAEGSAADDAARAAEACTWTHGGGQLAAVLCQPGLEQAVWAAAGRAACAGHELCAAWIYDDPAAVPDPVPATFEELTQDNVTSALAVWVGEDELLVTIAPAKAAK